MKLINTIILRTLGFPFYVGIALTYFPYLMIRYIVLYVIYGGEAIVYSKKLDRKGMSDIYEKVEELINKQTES